MARTDLVPQKRTVRLYPFNFDFWWVLDLVIMVTHGEEF